MSGRAPGRAPGEARLVAVTVGYLALVACLAGLPARWAVAAHQAGLGARFAPHLLVGLVVDLRDWLPVLVGLSLLLSLPAGRVVAGGRAGALRRATLVAAPAAWLLVPFLLVAAAEFRIERGLYPTLFDARLAAQDRGFVVAGLRVLLLPRYLMATAFASAAFVAATAGYARLTRGARGSASWLEPSLIGAAAAVAAACFGLHRASPLLLSGLASWRLVESPLFFLVRGAEYENIRLGAMASFERARMPAQLRAPGAAALGLPSESADRLDPDAPPPPCSPHPFAVPLPPSPVPAATDPLARELDDLSRALFEGREGKLRLWQVVLESLRADDVHGLNPAAPRDIAPTLTSLYERATAPRSGVVVSRWMMAAAHRTSQGFSAVLCGYGTMPQGLSFSRDFGLLPARCLPDVLKDAGFSPTFYHGANPGFDNMDAFLRYHGVDRMMTEHDYRLDQRFDGWGVPDGVVFSQAFDDASKRAEPRSQYNLLLTLTNHFPYVLPADAPAERVQAVSEAARQGREVTADDLARLQTLAYSDHTLGRFVEAVERSPIAAETLVVMVADHSEGSHLLWGEPSEKALPVGFARVPFVLLLPDPFVQASRDPEAAYAAIARLNDRLSREPISQNDLPRLLLHLLGSWQGLKAVPEPWRWHSLGGQRLSSSFRLADEPRAAVFGIRADTRVFAFDHAAAPLPFGGPVHVAAQAETGAEPTGLEPTGAWLSAWLQTHARACRAPTHVRATP